MKSLGGAIFVYNAIKHDYCYMESIACLKSFCDQVVIVDAGSDDGTSEALRAAEDYKTKVIRFDSDIWNLLQGREKLSHFSNVAIKNLDTDYVYYQQADEVTHEDSIPFIRQAVEAGAPAYMVTRYNLWKSPYLILNVPQERKPCSTEVIRLALTKYRCFDDAENISVDSLSFDFMDKIEMFHLGFVRKREVMKSKIVHMQEQIFQTPHDARLDEDEVFNPYRYFSDSDYRPLHKSLPKWVTKWAEERDYDKR